MVMVAYSMGQREVLPGMHWYDRMTGSTWEVVEPAGTRIYSPSGFGGTPNFWCRCVEWTPEAERWKEQAREDGQRLSARRYQCSRRGRIAHAQRSRLWRERLASREARDGAADDAHNVTHQGSHSGAAWAPLVAWTRPSLSVTTADMPADFAAQDAPVELAPAATPAMVGTCWTCRRCGAQQGAALRLGFVRHGVSHRRRHDHSP